MRHIDYARLRNYNVHKLLQYEITCTSLFLTKDEFLRKPAKSELAKENLKDVKKYYPAQVPANSNNKSMIAVDFMAYARKVPVKKLKLKTYEDFAKNLWNTFTALSKDWERMDIVFDLYLSNSIKNHERTR